MCNNVVELPLLLCLVWHLFGTLMNASISSILSCVFKMPWQNLILILTNSESSQTRSKSCILSHPKLLLKKLQLKRHQFKISSTKKSKKSLKKSMSKKIVLKKILLRKILLRNLTMLQWQ